DVTLAHELSHALHATWGDNDTSRVQPDDGVPEDAACGVSEAEHQASGLGKYRNDRLTENRYRAERRLLGEAHAAGAIDGDATMKQRVRYGCGDAGESTAG